MADQIMLTQEKFDKMESDILKQVTNVSKSLIETFKFRMIYGAKVSQKQNQATLKSLKRFRVSNWDKSLSRKKAYNKYVKLD
ncbi:MAG TPA: hypothetical protein HA362_08045 [Nanoarchaeota archaeon]|nr:hypothetical protein [Nanoarchaeota archaeon]